LFNSRRNFQFENFDINDDILCEMISYVRNVKTTENDVVVQ